VLIREAAPADLPFLQQMWHNAAFWQPEKFVLAIEDALAVPEIAQYIVGWGREGDYALVAETDGRPVGAAWFRRFTTATRGYGFVDEHTPELALGVVSDARRLGAGTALLQALIAAARAKGLPALSLSVNKTNPSRRIYQRCGFVDVSSDEDSYVMVLALGDAAIGADEP
jgi:GNAT superfamily N-acetyltransferase